MDHRVSVVNVHFPGLSAIQFAMLKRVFRLDFTLLLSFHGTDITQAAATNGLRRAFWRFLISSADNVIGCSEALTRDVVAFAPECRERAVAIHNGLDVDHFLASRDLQCALDERLRQRPFILSVASYDHHKGLDVLIRSFALIRSLAPPGLALVLVGVDRGLGGPLRRLAVEELDLADSVIFVEDVPHSRLHVYYSAATLFCLASRREAFGIVLLEAGAFACPVVATDVGGIPEIIAHGKTGRLCPADDVEALARELLDLLADREEQRRLGQSLRDYVRERFTWKAAAEAYLALTRKVNP